MAKFESVVQNNSKIIERNSLDFNSSFVDLKKRIEKYEHDRMSKYYR